MNSLSNTPSLQYSITPALLVLAEEFHDIAPPVDYSLIPPWLVFVIAFVVLSLLGLVVWWFVQRRKPELPPKAPREIALGELEQIRPEIETNEPVSVQHSCVRHSEALRDPAVRPPGNATNFHRVSHRGGKGPIIFRRRQIAARRFSEPLRSH